MTEVIQSQINGLGNKIRRAEAELEASKHRTKWQGIRYRCPRALYYGRCDGCQVCNGRGWITEREALKDYAWVSPSARLPYCHICLNQNEDEIFPYALTDKIIIQPDGNEDHCIHYIYRCRYSHGHEHPDWVFFDIFTDMEVNLL